MLKKVMGGAAALALGLSSLASSAYADPIGNPAASLSLGSVARTGAAPAHKSKLAGGAGIFAALIVAGVIAIGVIAATNNGRSSSN